MKQSILERYVKIIVVLAVLAGATSGIFGKAISASSMAIGFWRLTMGVPFFAVPVILKKRDALRRLTVKELLLTTLAGIFLFGHFFSWYSAVKMTTISSASVLASLHPLVVLFFSILVEKKRVAFRPVLGILLAILGAAMVAGFDYRQLSMDSFAGDLFGLAAGLFMGLYFSLGNVVRRTVDGMVYVFLVFGVCWVCFGLGMLFTGTPALGYPTMDYIYLLLLTLVCQIGAHAVFNLCIGHVDSLYISAWETGDCVFATLLSLILLGQVPTDYQIIGCVVVVVGLLYYNFRTSLAEKALQEEGRT